MSDLNWSKIKTETGTLYTYAGSRKSIYVPIGNGDNNPTPSEIAQALNTGEVDRIAYETGGKVGIKTLPEEVSGNASVLPGGTYRYIPPGWGTPAYLSVAKTRQDSAIKRKAQKIVSKDIEIFLNSENQYKDIGIQFKRGVLMYGPPGEGKTTIIRQLAKDKMFDEAIMIFANKLPVSEFLDHLRKHESDRIKIFIFEELAVVLDSPWASMDEILDFLDGETSVDKSIIIATTNYPERLPMNIVDRPSRFDLLLEIGPPDLLETKKLVKHYLGMDLSDEELSVLKDFSTATIKECCLMVKLRKMSLAEAAKFMRIRRETIHSGFGNEKDVGLNESLYAEDGNPRPDSW